MGLSVSVWWPLHSDMGGRTQKYSKSLWRERNLFQISKIQDKLDTPLGYPNFPSKFWLDRPDYFLAKSAVTEIKTKVIDCSPIAAAIIIVTIQQHLQIASVTAKTCTLCLGSLKRLVDSFHQSK